MEETAEDIPDPEPEPEVVLSEEPEVEATEEQPNKFDPDYCY